MPTPLNKDLPLEGFLKTEKGIYKIVCLENKRAYIGQSADMKLRLKTHAQGLVRGKHHCKDLQKDFDQFGMEKFRVTILKLCDTKELASTEIRTIHKAIKDGDDLYNKVDVIEQHYDEYKTLPKTAEELASYIAWLHSSQGLSWRKIAALPEFEGIKMATLYRFSKGNYIPKDNAIRRKLLLPEIYHQEVHRDEKGQFVKVE